MPRITVADRTYIIESRESVLECLTRHEVAVPSSCRNGICQTCLMLAVKGIPPGSSQEGLKPSLQREGYFLACICKPDSDLEAVLAGDAVFPKREVMLTEKVHLSGGIVRLRLHWKGSFEYRAGQFINLHRPDGLIRSYSIASIPGDPFLELHIEHIRGGHMSAWIREQVAVGDTVVISGPHGDCYYHEEAPEQNLLLIGTGSGVAPLAGVIRDALAHQHRGQIHLFHGSRHIEKLYLDETLRELAAEYPNFHYTPCLSGSDAALFVARGIQQGRANEIALANHPQLKGWRVFLCGHPAMVKSTQRKAFIAGAALKEIHADPFEFSPAPN